MAETSYPIDLSAVRRALRSQLADHGHRLSGDTAGTHRPLFILGDNDLARAVFEVKPSADDALYDLMCQGSWAPGMPPRFAVIPVAGAGSESLETLLQMEAIPLLFKIDGDTVEFPDLDRLLGEHLDSGQAYDLA